MSSKGIAGFLALLVSCLLTLGCTSKTEKRSATVQIANPASSHCINQGGKIEIKKDASGAEYGICHLPDGTVIDEWELFRRDNPPPKE
ncbi:DUF333 domain-containing protein [Methylobacillus arboreus]|uniref:putative hemolysin n=1 Tax=Methylobacillus arboreus TaxID=755170 RepID=UPI001E6192D2|nr:DUF333 domain-containing protein [Methylobacillus arboreus]MCB5190183.1 DUF333 domain-containing protein [Methylobacillus arboreus]